MRPFFTIVLPTFNRAALIPRSIESILRQDFLSWELIIVDDASTDDTQSVLSHFIHDARIKVIRNEINLERSKTRNRGIEAANGEFICFLDSDDYWSPAHLAELYKLIHSKGNAIALYHSNVQKKCGNVYEQQLQIKIDPTNPVQSVIKDNVPVICVAIHHSIFKSYKFDSTLVINEDVYLFALIVSSFPFFGHEKPTAVWVIHERNTNAVVKDHLLRELHAKKAIFNDPALRRFFSKQFRKNVIHDLYIRLSQEYSKSVLEASKYLIMAFAVIPSFQRKKNAIVNIIYRLPLGIHVQSIVRAIKGAMP